MRMKNNHENIGNKSSIPGPEILLNPTAQEDVILNRRQLLQQSLPLRTPIVPEAVQLGPGVLNLQLALDQVNTLNDLNDEHEDNIDEESGRPRRSTRLEINYVKYDRTGEK